MDSTIQNIIKYAKINNDDKELTFDLICDLNVIDTSYTKTYKTKSSYFNAFTYITVGEIFYYYNGGADYYGILTKDNRYILIEHAFNGDLKDISYNIKDILSKMKKVFGKHYIPHINFKESYWHATINVNIKCEYDNKYKETDGFIKPCMQIYHPIKLWILDSNKEVLLHAIYYVPLKKID